MALTEAMENLVGFARPEEYKGGLQSTINLAKGIHEDVNDEGPDDEDSSSISDESDTDFKEKEDDLSRLEAGYGL